MGEHIHVLAAMMGKITLLIPEGCQLILMSNIESVFALDWLKTNLCSQYDYFSSHPGSKYTTYQL